MKDLDMNNHSSWQGALDMIFTLCGEAADLSFDCRMLGGRKTPTVDFRLDDPAELELPQVSDESGVKIEKWEYGTVVIADSEPQGIADDSAYLLKSTGAAAVTYNAFKEAVRVLKALGLTPEFAWTSVPLAPLCDDISVTLEREAASYKYGAVHTIWVRCESDEDVKKALAAVSECGEVRVQNMATANTWIAGKVDEEALLQSLANR